jgi:hypothetical protein
MGRLIYINIDDLPRVDKKANVAFLSRDFLQVGKVLKLQALHVIDDNKVAWADVTTTEPEVPLYEAMKHDDDADWLCVINAAAFVWRHAYKDGFNQVWILHKYLSESHPAIFGGLRGIVEISDEANGNP